MRPLALVLSVGCSAAAGESAEFLPRPDAGTTPLLGTLIVDPIVLVDEQVQVRATIRGAHDTPVFYRFTATDGTLESDETVMLPTAKGVTVETSWRAPSMFAGAVIRIVASYDERFMTADYLDAAVEVRKVLGRTTGSDTMLLEAGTIFAFPIDLPADLGAHSLTIGTTNTHPTAGYAGLYFGNEAPSGYAGKLGTLTYEGTTTLQFDTHFTAQRLWFSFRTVEPVVIYGTAGSGARARYGRLERPVVELPAWFPTIEVTDVDFAPLAFLTVGPPPQPL
jgi:hypothetical protein